MQFHIVARGKMGRKPEQEIIDRYAKRLGGALTITELPDSGGRMPERNQPDRTIALDEKGEILSSMQMAERIRDWRDSGMRELRFLIGSADGLNEQERASADMLWSFGRATWPHMLVRVMLTEQLWRASAILSGHPYHREG